MCIRDSYGIEDLVYDAEGIGPQIQVAVIARETLALSLIHI